MVGEQIAADLGVDARQASTRMFGGVVFAA